MLPPSRTASTSSKREPELQTTRVATSCKYGRSGGRRRRSVNLSFSFSFQIPNLGDAPNCHALHERDFEEMGEGGRPASHCDGGGAQGGADLADVDGEAV